MPNKNSISADTRGKAIHKSLDDFDNDLTDAFDEYDWQTLLNILNKIQSAGQNIKKPAMASCRHRLKGTLLPFQEEGSMYQPSFFLECFCKTVRNQCGRNASHQ